MCFPKKREEKVCACCCSKDEDSTVSFCECNEMKKSFDERLKALEKKSEESA